MFNYILHGKLIYMQNNAKICANVKHVNESTIFSFMSNLKFVLCLNHYIIFSFKCELRRTYTMNLQCLEFYCLQKRFKSSRDLIMILSRFKI